MTFACSGWDGYLVSYDVSGAARSIAARVRQIVFGRRRIVSDRTREALGFIYRAGLLWIGQSVLAMRPRMRTILPHAYDAWAYESWWAPWQFPLDEHLEGFLASTGLTS